MPFDPEIPLCEVEAAPHPFAREIEIVEEMERLLAVSWCKGGEGGSCLIHTLEKVISFASPEWFIVSGALRVGIPTGMGDTLVDFNDNRRTTHSHILALLARAKAHFVALSAR